MEHITFGQLPAVRITAPDGATATVTLYGAHLVSWQGADGGERMFVSRRSALDASRAIRGGVPVIFPQFSEQGDGMRHGFARVSNWQLAGSGVDDGVAWAEFGLQQDNLPRALASGWPHRFALALRVSVRANALRMDFTVRNTGDAPFPFAAALHTYHLVPQLADVRIGGVPVIFPQFSEQGDGMRHGFARVSNWQLAGSGVDDDAAWAEFGLQQDDLPRALASGWPHRFALALRVSVRANALHMDFTVRNTGDAPFPFAAALHTYHLVPQLADVRIDGVQAGTLSIDDKLDRVYAGVEGTITLATPARVLTLEQQGFTDAVVWNPGAADTAALSDMEDDEYQRFVCIEPAQLTPVNLAAGAQWQGHYRIQ